MFNPRIFCINPRIRRFNPRVFLSNPRVFRLNPRISGIPLISIRAHNRRFKDECAVVEYRIGKTDCLQLLAHPVNAFAVLLHIAVIFQERSDFRIPREVSVADVLLLHYPGKGTGTVHFQPVIKHLDLDVRAFDAVISVSSGIHHNLGADEFTVFFLGNENAVMAEIGFFLHLDFDEVNRLFHLLQNASFKYHILDHVHILADLCLRTVVADKADKGAGEEELRILAKQQDCCY